MDNKRPKSRFQSTLPRRERLPATPKLEHFRYFNPRSREGSDRVAISSFVYLLYFNPRSREGSDYVGGFMITLYSDFNPRSREGSDIIKLLVFTTYHISIHAPAKGATQFLFRLVCHDSDFNPRSREGSDNSLVILHVYSSLFQSTLPRRERHSTRTTTQRKRTISIHAPAKGATCTVRRLCHVLAISIHAPAKGATLQ